MNNLDYSRLFECFGRVYTPVKTTESGGNTRTDYLASVVKNIDSDHWKVIIELFYNTDMLGRAHFDELFRLLNRYHDIQVSEYIEEVNKCSLSVKNYEGKLGFEHIMTESSIVSLDDEHFSEKTRVIINDYDYVSKTITVKTFRQEKTI